MRDRSSQVGFWGATIHRLSELWQHHHSLAPQAHADLVICPGAFTVVQAPTSNKLLKGVKEGYQTTSTSLFNTDTPLGLTFVGQIDL